MEFTSGVLFVTDNSKKVDDSNGISNNVFADVVTDGVKYVDAPYAKMYSIA
jgi:hypothetical protein